MSERLIISHYENNYGGAVKRLNLIEEQLSELDYARAMDRAVSASFAPNSHSRLDDFCKMPSIVKVPSDSRNCTAVPDIQTE